MKRLLLLSAIATCSAHAAVTIGFNGGGNIAQNFQNAAGDVNSTLVWGIIVDTGNDGFDGLDGMTSTTINSGTLWSGTTKYDYGTTIRGTTGTSAITGGQFLSVGGLASDDLVLYSGSLMSVVGGINQLTSVASINYATNGVVGAGNGTPGAGTAGDDFLVFWFDKSTVAAFGTATAAGDKVGFFRNSGMDMPADPGTYTTTTALIFAGAESPMAMGGTFVPEASTALLGALGALGLLRRRR
jgi:hypothetical protein